MTLEQRVGIAITGSGSALPERMITNDDLGQIVETSDEWIATRTGIRQRRVIAPDGSLTDLATQAGVKAIAAAGLAVTEIDLIILATSTPDDLFGSAGTVQAGLGATRAVAFDLTAACSGFVFGLVTAAQFIRTGAYQNILLIGADVLSRWVDWGDRRTCILFGDGAGAVVLQSNPVDQLLGFSMHSDGQLNHQLNLGYQGQAKPLMADVELSDGTFQSVTMNGQEVYRFAVRRVPEVVGKALFQAGLPPEAIDWLVLHQANQRILDAAASRLKVPPEKVLSNVANYGNTSAATIPIVLDESVRQGKILPGQCLAMAGFGAGLSWGAAIVRWGKSEV
ncbi:beta-ketoacyl-ACP synthase 3 [filamentous cyanobacterium LEGE 11480]|uniref:Beta-ketoacyl-[acyl-carrier-protein] synthase III n=2 Tax=Romeriopsis TaxID=2992131 RepID=A0A928VKH1_9CYAN|nr:beta-ketoacyl-ACP synthase 3 [Romeriopsis navalis LEGE 11480]